MQTWKLENAGQNPKVFIKHAEKYSIAVFISQWLKHLIKMVSNSLELFNFPTHIYILSLNDSVVNLGCVYY